VTIWRPLVLSIGLMVVVLIGFGIPHFDDPRESLCGQGEELRTGRLLGKSDELFARAGREGHACGNTGSAEVSHEQDDSLEAFSAAGVQAAVDPASATAPEATIKAIDLYVKGLEINPFDANAITALGALLAKQAPPKSEAEATARCKLADKLVDAGLLASAAPMISGGLPLAAEPCEAVSGRLDRRRAEGAERLRKAQALGSDGERAAARAEYALSVRADPSLNEAREGLEHGVETGSVLDAVGRRISDVPATLRTSLSWLLPLAIAALLAVLLVRLGLTALAKRRPSARRRLIRWGERPWMSFVRAASVPSVGIDDFSGGEAAKGQDFSTLLATALPRKAGREPAFPFDRVNRGSADDQSAATAVGNLLEALPETKLIGTILKGIEGLYKRRSIAVAGHLAPAADRGAGVSIELEGVDAPATASISLWEKDFDPLPGGDGAGRWLRLLPAATVWTRWQLAAAYSVDGEAMDPEGWKADALFQAGLAWQEANDLPRAAALYEGALERDANLLVASYNLAIVDLREERYAEARDRLLALQQRLETEPELEVEDLLLALLYPLAVALSYLELGDPT